MLCDPGAYPEPPLSGKITWRVMQPQREPKSEEERAQVERLQTLVQRVKNAAEERQRRSQTDASEGPEDST